MSARRNLSLLLTLLVPAIAHADGAGQLTAVSGSVTITPPGGSDSKAKLGQSVEAGSRLRTGPDGQAEVTLVDGSKLAVRADSSVMLSGSKRPAKKKNSVLVFFGRVWSKVAKSQTGGVSYEVNSPNAVAGVRGTEFETSVGDDGSARVRVTEGKVAVSSEGQDVEEVGANEQVDANSEGVEDAEPAPSDPSWKQWQSDKRARAKTEGTKIVGAMKDKLTAKQQKLESLRARQKELESKRKGLEARARGGDEAALREIKRINEELAALADAIADLGDAATSQFGYVDHLADLAGDPRFGMINAKTLEAEAKNLRKLKASFDKMVKEGTDLSVEAMDKMLDDMSKGKGTLNEKKGSTVKDMFDNDEMDMKR